MAGRRICSPSQLLWIFQAIHRSLCKSKEGQDCHFSRYRMIHFLPDPGYRSVAPLGTQHRRSQGLPRTSFHLSGSSGLCCTRVLCRGCRKHRCHFRTFRARCSLLGSRFERHHAQPFRADSSRCRSCWMGGLLR